MGYGPDPSGYDPAGRDDHHGDPAAEPGPAPTPSPVPGERPWLCVHTLSESDPCEATNPHRGCIWANAPSAAPSAPGEGSERPRPDTSELRKRCVEDDHWVAEVQAPCSEAELLDLLDWIDAQPAPLTPTPQREGGSSNA